MRYAAQKRCPRLGKWIDQDYYQAEELEAAIAVCRLIAKVDGCQARVQDLLTGDTVFQI